MSSTQNTAPLSASAARIREKLREQGDPLRDFCAGCGVTERTGYNWIKAGLPHFKLGNTNFVKHPEGMAWLLTHRQSRSARSADPIPTPRPRGRPRRFNNTTPAAPR